MEAQMIQRLQALEQAVQAGAQQTATAEQRAAAAEARVDTAEASGRARATRVPGAAAYRAPQELVDHRGSQTFFNPLPTPRPNTVTYYYPYSSPDSSTRPSRVHIDFCSATVNNITIPYTANTSR